MKVPPEETLLFLMMIVWLIGVTPILDDMNHENVLDKTFHA
jgi:hypothetical protein